MTENCKELKSPLLPIFLLPQSISDQKYVEEYLAKVKECRFIVDPVLIAQMTALKLGKLDYDGLIAHLKSNKISKAEIDVVKGIYRKWQSQKRAELVLSDLQSVFDNYQTSTPRHENYLKIKPLLLKSQKNESEEARALFDFIFSLFSDNRAWIKKSARQLITYHPFSFRFSFFENQGKDFKYSEFISSLTSFLEKTISKIDDEQLREMTLNHLDLIFYSSYGQKFSLSSSFSLADIRTQSKSIFFGKSFFDYWFSRANGRTSYEESNAILNEHLTNEKLRSLEIHRLWVLESIIKGDSEWRKIMVEKIDKLEKSKDFFEKEIFINLISDPIIKQEYSKMNKEYSTPYFRIEREHYRQCLNNRFNSEYCMFHLIQIGDIDQDLSWYFLINQIGVFQ